MIPNSPSEALGSNASGLRELLVEVIQARHARAAEAHLVSGSRYQMGFGSQWRDLLDDTCEALESRGFQTSTLSPGGHAIPVVSDCLIYVWRVPNTPHAVSQFASSPTRMSSFTTEPSDPMLWEPNLLAGEEVPQDTSVYEDIDSILSSSGNYRPVVLVMVQSTPALLQSIAWAIAAPNDAGKVELYGPEKIWEPETVMIGDSLGVESFDSGSPVEPKVEAREEEGMGLDV